MGRIYDFARRIDKIGAWMFDEDPENPKTYSLGHISIMLLSIVLLGWVF